MLPDQSDSYGGEIDEQPFPARDRDWLFAYRDYSVPGHRVGFVFAYGKTEEDAARRVLTEMALTASMVWPVEIGNYYSLRHEVDHHDA